MYLSKLDIVGFKSFAQKVTLHFDSGISAIVGPNGCGKTNIVDAIRWVLGEQRYSALRSEKMEDVIFNGTKQRKPLGMAEVSLIIENTKGILPSEYTQVTVGRRVYRSGESEYLLNKIPCRLKDILDLFMDTGMGADAYSVIELKMVETILSDKTDERRHLFEEAAGVTKYKHRRKAAYRKLESVQADLVRVNDIVSEVQKAVNSLERQAKRAEQFHGMKDRLRALEIDLSEREYAQLIERARPLSERLTTLQTEESRIDGELTADESRLEDLHSRMTDIDRRLTIAMEEVDAAKERIQRVEEKNLVAAERTKALQENIRRFEQEQQVLGTELEQLSVDKTSLEARLAELAGQEQRAQHELETRQEELRDAEARLEAKKAALQSLNERMIAIVHEIADRQTDIDRKKGRLENLRGRATHAAEENTAYDQESRQLEGDIASLTSEDRQLRRSFTEAEMKFYEAETQKKNLKTKVEELQRQMAELNNEVSAKTAKADFLKGLLESREGLSEGVRHLATTGKWKPRRKGTVGDVVYADERFRTAIEAALGDFTNLLIVDAADDIEHGIAVLTEDQRGKATFVSLDRLPVVQTRVRVPQLAGVHGWAADLAQYDRALAPLFRFLLDRVLVVDTVASARKITTRLSGVKCVTLRGEIVTSVGIVRGGSLRQDEGGTIGKNRQIEDLQAEIVAVRGHLQEIDRSRDNLLRQHDAIDLKGFTDAVKTIEKEMNSVEMRIAQLEFEKKRAGDLVGRNVELMTDLADEIAELEQSIAAESPALDARRLEKGEIERGLGAVANELQALEGEWSERARVVNDLGITVVTIRGELLNAGNDLKRIEEKALDVRESIERHRIDSARAHSDIAATEEAVGGNLKMVLQLQMELSNTLTQRETVEQELERCREDVHEVEQKIKDLRRTHDETLKNVHDHEMKISELNAKADHIKARALEEFEVSIELKSYPPEEFVDFAALRDTIQALRDRLKSLGNINFAAFEEYRSEKERFEFLSTQRNDLLEAEKTLLATIEEINNTAQKKFLDTFALIRTNFIETFKSLFDPGDECDLRLEEGVDPLEAKIDIIAKPRGKRPTSIDLLSGGEKTLTATALLFAIYLVKPSPFCILDEVDAPLDDANIDRFTRILTKFSNNTQFIVVTHNKRTMEAANALYGVTMEEEGVSKLVTVRFNHGAAVQSAAIAAG
jgi:chromosome segregation protein